MKNKYILLLLFVFWGIHASAQTLAQAKALYEKGQYEQAKPAFKKFVKSQPNNGNYNLWYGVCCLNTGEAEEAIKYLETAVKRRATSGQLFLAQAYNATYRFEDAVNTYEDYIAELAKRKRSTTEAEKLLEKSKANLRLLKGVEEVCFIDSFVVDKKIFSKHIKSVPNPGNCLCTMPTLRIPMVQAVPYTKRSWEIRFIIASYRKIVRSISCRATK